MRKQDRSMHQGVRRRRHVCLYCSAEKYKTYSTFLDWRNHLLDTHEHCLEDNDGSTTWRGTRPTGPICASPLCESTMASTRFRKRESHRDHRPPSAFLKPKAPRLTETSHGRSRSGPGAIMETRARKRGRSHRQRATNRDPSRR